MTCPCEDCLCVPMCRHKPYNELVTKCLLINKYLVQPYQASKRPTGNLKKLKEILKPTRWYTRTGSFSSEYLYIRRKNKPQ